MAHKKYYTRDELWDTGTKVRTKANGQYKHWTDYVGTVVGFRWRQDGGIDYRVRAWRTNQHWWPAEELVLVRDEQLCANCRRLIDCTCDCHCNHKCKELEY